MTRFPANSYGKVSSNVCWINLLVSPVYEEIDVPVIFFQELLTFVVTFDISDFAQVPSSKEQLIIAQLEVFCLSPDNTFLRWC